MATVAFSTFDTAEAEISEESTRGSSEGKTVKEKNVHSKMM